MKIDEAIKQLRSVIQADERDFPSILEDAMKLGIEALKRIKNEREIQGGLYNYELPGEIED